MIVQLTGVGAVLVAMAALAVLWQIIVPSPPPLARRVASLYEPPREVPDRLRARWQMWAMRALGFAGGDRRTLEQNLAVCGETMEHHAVAKLGFAVCGATAPLAVVMVWRAAGFDLAWGSAVFMALIGAPLGFVLPEFKLRARAEQRRREFRYALSLFLELVVITLAGGAGVNEALRMSAQIGSGWAFEELQLALRTAFLQASSPWVALQEVGLRIGSDDLIEVASSVALAVTHGAPPEEQLAAKAATVRDHEQAAMKAEAVATSERMGGPMIAMFAALILLIGYPAFVQIAGV
jgi:tight adherence protein C